MDYARVVDTHYLTYPITIYRSSDQLVILTLDIGKVLGVTDITARVKGDGKTKQRIQGGPKHTKAALTIVGINTLRSSMKPDGVVPFCDWAISKFDEIQAAQVRVVEQQVDVITVPEQAQAEPTNSVGPTPLDVGVPANQPSQLVAEFRKIVFNNDITIPVYGSVSRPLFLATEVGAAIGVKNVHASIRKYKEDEKECNLVTTLGGVQECVFLTRLGFISLCFKVKTPTSRPFCEWVVKVLDEVAIKGYHVAEQQGPHSREKLMSCIRELEDRLLDLDHKQHHEEQTALFLKTPQSKCQLSRPNNSSPKNNTSTGFRKSVSLPLQQGTLPTTEYPVFKGNARDFVGPCGYLLHLGGSYFKYGITENIVGRLGQHENLFGKSDIIPTIVTLYICNTLDAVTAVEGKIDSYCKQHRLHVRECNQREIIMTSDITPLLAVIPRYVEEEDARIFNKLSIKSERVQLEELKLKQMEIDASVKIAEANARTAEVNARIVEANLKMEAVKLAQLKIASAQQSTPAQKARSTTPVSNVHRPTVTQPIIDHQPTAYQDNIAHDDSPPVVIVHGQPTIHQASEPQVSIDTLPQQEPITITLRPAKQYCNTAIPLLPAADFNTIVKTYTVGKYWIGQYSGYDAQGHGPSHINASKYCREVSKHNKHYLHKWYGLVETKKIIAHVVSVSGIPKATLYVKDTHFNIEKHTLAGTYVHRVLLPYLIEWLLLPQP